LVKGSHGMKMERIAAQICDDFGGDKINGDNKKIH
jgi:hypothetical protein